MSGYEKDCVLVVMAKNSQMREEVNPAVLKLGVTTLFRAAKYFLRVAKVYTTRFSQVNLP